MKNRTPEVAVAGIDNPIGCDPIATMAVEAFTAARRLFLQNPEAEQNLAKTIRNRKLKGWGIGEG